MTEQLARAVMAGADLQVIHVTVRDGYRPRAIVARAGVPLRLVFHRDEDVTCSERVVFSSPHLDRRLVAHGETPIELPAQEPGEVRFTCAMGRYRGVIRLVQPARSHLVWNRVRHQPARTVAAASTVGLALVAMATVALAVPDVNVAPLLAVLVIAVLVVWLTLAVRGSSASPEPHSRG